MSTSAPAQTLNPLNLLIELGQAFHSTLELDELLLSILQFLQNTIESEIGAIWLMKSDQTEIECRSAIGPGAEGLVGHISEAGKFLVAYLDQPTNCLRVDDLARAPDWARPFAEPVRLQARNLLFVSLVARNELLGQVGLFNKRGEPAFGEADAELLSVLADYAAVAIQNALIYDQEHRNEGRQILLEQISRYLQQTLDLEVLIPRIFSEVNKAIDAEAQSIWLVDEQAGTIVCRFATGPETDKIKQVAVPVGQGIVGSCVEKQEAIIIADAQKDSRHFHGADGKTGLVTHSIMSVPMVREGKSIGAIQAINKKNGALFDHDDLELFRRIADSAALAIENARLYADLDTSYNNTLDALTAALDMRDRETEGHSRRVVEYTSRLARQIHLDSATIAVIRRGALIHDIGKIGVPDAVLLKPGPLNSEERRIIEKHPLSGYEMLLGIPYLQEEIKIVLGHQEKWDGTGYPFGLKGEAIPLGARLFAIADTFDALLSDRPYRKGRPYAVARQVIAEESGKQFDPLAVAAFLEIRPEEWEQIRVAVMADVGQRRQFHDILVSQSLSGGVELPAAVAASPRLAAPLPNG
jgi:HD-GYP domain-containing protein (c-di-GMP phosphodiesterase class II)